MSMLPTHLIPAGVGGVSGNPLKYNPMLAFDGSSINNFAVDESGTLPPEVGLEANRWYDKSAQQNHFQATGNTRPVIGVDAYGNHFLRANGVEDFMQTIKAMVARVGGELSVFIVYESRTASANLLEESVNVGGGPEGFLVHTGAGVTRIQGSLGYWSGGSLAAPVGQKSIRELHSSDGEQIVLDDGVLSGVPGSDVLGNMGGDIGYLFSRAGTGNFLDGDIYRVYAYPFRLTAEEATAVRGWIYAQENMGPQPPVLSDIEPDPIVYQSGSLAITSTLSVYSDEPITGATVRVLNGYINGEDVLEFSDTANITGSWDASDGTMYLSGSDTASEYEAAMRSVRYRNVGDPGTDGFRDMRFVASNANGSSNSQVRQVDVQWVAKPWDPSDEPSVQAWFQSEAASVLHFPSPILDKSANTNNAAPLSFESNFNARHTAGPHGLTIGGELVQLPGGVNSRGLYLYRGNATGLRVENHPSIVFSGNQPFSISYFIKIHSWDGTGGVFGMMNNVGGANGYFTPLTTTRSFRFGWTGSANIDSTAFSLNLLQWYHVLYTWDGSQFNKIYVDGVEDASGDQSSALPPGSTQPLRIGDIANQGDADVEFAEIRIYGKDMSADVLTLLRGDAGLALTDELRLRLISDDLAQPAADGDAGIEWLDQIGAAYLNCRGMKDATYRDAANGINGIPAIQLPAGSGLKWDADLSNGQAAGSFDITFKTPASVTGAVRTIVGYVNPADNTQVYSVDIDAAGNLQVNSNGAISGSSIAVQPLTNYSLTGGYRGTQLYLELSDGVNPTQSELVTCPWVNASTGIARTCVGTKLNDIDGAIDGLQDGLIVDSSFFDADITQ